MLPFLTCVALTLSVGPASFSLKWSLAMGMLYIGQAALLRTLFMEQEFKVGYSFLASSLHALCRCALLQMALYWQYNIARSALKKGPFTSFRRFKSQRPSWQTAIQSSESWTA